MKSEKIDCGMCDGTGWIYDLNDRRRVECNDCDGWGTVETFDADERGEPQKNGNGDS